MPRVSPLGIDGTSVTYRDYDSNGRPGTAMVRARDERGVYQTKRFKVTSWRRGEKTPILPEAAKDWAKETRKTFLAGTAVAGVATIQEFIEAVAVIAVSEKVKPERVQIMRKIGLRLADAGISDMKALTFAPRVRSWLDGLDTNWAYDEGYKFRRADPTPLADETKNRILDIIHKAVDLAVARRRLPFDPLIEMKRYRTSAKLKPLFTVDELRQLVSDDARFAAAAERERLQARLDATKLGRMAAVAQVAAEDGVHWTTIYNRLRREPEPDQWWLPCCLLAYTGARAQEGLHLRWEWINWEAGIITLKERDDYELKTGERLIPLEPELRDILYPIRKSFGWIIDDKTIRDGGDCKPNPKTGEIPRDYQRFFASYCGRIGVTIGDCTVHSLRHCFITMKIARADMNPDRLRKGVGHATIRTTLHYGSQSQEYEAVVDQWPDASLHLRRSVAKQKSKAG